MILHINNLITQVTARTNTSAAGGPRGNFNWVVQKPINMSIDTWKRLETLAARVSDRIPGTIRAPKLASVLLEVLLEQEFPE